MKYLFQVSIGPVQAFIASARRTRDLKFGSWLLSELAKATAKKIVDRGGELIFPAPTSEDCLNLNSDMNVANKIVALIDSERGTPQELGTDIYQAVLERLRDIRKEAYGKVKDTFYREVAEKQVDDLVEYFWVAVPFEPNKYKDNRQEVEAIMAARKNTRDFDPVFWGDQQFKSSIDGQLESVIPKDRYAQHKNTTKVKTSKANDLYTKYGAGPAEYLSGVDLLKRHGVTGTTSSFPSTSHMASLPFLARLQALKNQEQAKNLWDKYTEELRKVAIGRELETVSLQYTIPTFLNNLEGSMLFEERFVDVVDIADADYAKKEQIQIARSALRSFYDYVDEQLGKARPYPYYAILLADGDRMGKTIDHLAEDKDGQEKHKELSQRLDAFAEGVDAIVSSKDCNGALIYAGGDDVLALVPLHTVIQCARKLSDSFKKTLQSFNDGKDAPTLSVGIAIVHHLDSLQASLNLARTTENKAKSVRDKNALAITIRKRSGSETSIAGKWGNLDTHLEKLINYYSEDAIPDGTAYELEELSLRLSPHGDDTLQTVVLQEAKRIIHRKLHGPQDTLTSDRAKEIEAYLLDRLRIRANMESNENSAVPLSVENFVNELLVAQTLADVRKIANYKEK